MYVAFIATGDCRDRIDKYILYAEKGDILVLNTVLCSLTRTCLRREGSIERNHTLSAGPSNTIENLEYWIDKKLIIQYLRKDTPILF